MLLGQILYTSFSNTGFKLLASSGVSESVQRDFLQGVVGEYWNAHNPPPRYYRAVYLRQASLEGCLFGWLYNDGKDDIGRNNVPYFIGHYLQLPLNASLAELLFAFLSKGPVIVPDRQKLTVLKEVVPPDLWTYRPQRSGVTVSAAMRMCCHDAIRQEQLVDVFTPIAKEELVVALDEVTCEQLTQALAQHIGPIARVIVLETVAGLTGVLDPYEQAKQVSQRLASEVAPSDELVFRQEVDRILNLAGGES